MQLSNGGPHAFRLEGLAGLGQGVGDHLKGLPFRKAFLSKNSYGSKDANVALIVVWPASPAAARLALAQRDGFHPLRKDRRDGLPSRPMRPENFQERFPGPRFCEAPIRQGHEQQIPSRRVGRLVIRTVHTRYYLAEEACVYLACLTTYDSTGGGQRVVIHGGAP